MHSNRFMYPTSLQMTACRLPICFVGRPTSCVESCNVHNVAYCKLLSADLRNCWIVFVLRTMLQRSSTETQRSWDSLWRTWTSSRSTIFGWWLTMRTERAPRRKRSLCAPSQTLPANLQTMSRLKLPAPRSHALLHQINYCLLNPNVTIKFVRSFSINADINRQHT